MIASYLGIGSAPLIATALTAKNSVVQVKGTLNTDLLYVSDNIAILRLKTDKPYLVEIRCSNMSITTCIYESGKKNEIIDMFALSNKTLIEYVSYFCKAVNKLIET